MIQRTIVAGFLSGLMAAISAAPGSAAELAGDAFREEQVTRLIVKPRASAGLSLALQAHDVSSLARTANTGLVVARAMSGGAHVLQLERPLPLEQAQTLARQLMRDPAVEYAEPDRIVRPAEFTPTDPHYGEQWHYFAPDSLGNRGGASLPRAWHRGRGNQAIVVAVLDTGHVPHEDLESQRILPGYDFISDSLAAADGGLRDNDPTDPGDGTAAGECGEGSSKTSHSWHGLHVTGIIAAQLNNNLGGAGIAPQTRILPVRVLGKCGGLLSDVVDAMRWSAGLPVTGVPANANPAHLLNLSLGASGACSQSFRDAVNAVRAAGKIIVAAAGNDKQVGVHQPANCDGVIAVTAHARDGDNASYASVGAAVMISAPGGGCGYLARLLAACGASTPGVLSLSRSGDQLPAREYSAKAGTSMAAPHVAGTLALMLAHAPFLPETRAKAHLQGSARPHPTGTSCAGEFSGQCGAGLLDAGAALQSLLASAPRIVAAPEQTVEAGASLTVDLRSSVTDPDGDAVTFHAVSLPAGASLSATGILSWPSAVPVGRHTASYYVTDSTGLRSDQNLLSIAVAAGTRSPAGGTSAADSGGGGGGVADPLTLTALAILVGGMRWQRLLRLKRRRPAK